VSTQFCVIRGEFLSELATKSNEVATAAARLAKLAAMRGNATLDDKVDFSNLRTYLKVLLDESDAIHERLKDHQDDHGC
jgi:hypothetical protein